MKSLTDRFFAKILKGAYSTCWLWTGAKHNFGYGKIFSKVGAPPLSAHRLSFELHKGPVPKGMDVCHSCDNPSCVNPDHLFAGTAKDNINDCISKGRFMFPSSGIKNRAKTHCDHGHPFDAANTCFYAGRRVCRECSRINRRRWNCSNAV